MLLRVPNVLDAAQVRGLRTGLDAAGEAWVDGRATAGHQGAQVKRNRQIAEGSAVARELGNVIVGALERNPLFLSAALPARIYPPMFNRYEDAETFGAHVDGGVRLLPDRLPAFEVARPVRGHPLGQEEIGRDRPPAALGRLGHTF